MNDHLTWTWLMNVKGDGSQGQCILCKANFDVNNVGLHSITSQEKGKKHGEGCKIKSTTNGMLVQLTHKTPK